jgi:hypothetical protein
VVYKSAKDYPEKLRRVVYGDPATKKKYLFLTNDLEAPALTIAGFTATDGASSCSSSGSSST